MGVKLQMISSSNKTSSSLKNGWRVSLWVNKLSMKKIKMVHESDLKVLVIVTCNRKFVLFFFF